MDLPRCSVADGQDYHLAHHETVLENGAASIHIIFDFVKQAIFSPIAALASNRRQSGGCGPLAAAAVARCETFRPLSSRTAPRLLQGILTHRSLLCVPLTKFVGNQRSVYPAGKAAIFPRMPANSHRVRCPPRPTATSSSVRA